MHDKLREIILETARFALDHPGETPEFVLTALAQRPEMHVGFCQVCGRKKRPAVRKPPEPEYVPPWYVDVEP